MLARLSLILLCAGLVAAGPASAQGAARAAQLPQSSAAAPVAPAAEDNAPAAIADAAELAFEQGRWEDAIREYRAILADYAADRLSLLRIAQAQRELKRYDEALATLEQARTSNAPEAMIDF